jgi:RNA polymerase sigma-70 factor (ECF subfamily)
MPLDPEFDGVLAAAKAGAEWAIATLYREFQPPILRYLRAHAPSDGEDLASEVWLDAAAGLVRFEGDEYGFRRWLFTIAHRRLVDQRRRDARQRSLLGSLERSEYENPTNGDAKEAAATDTEAALALIAKLPRDQAEIVFLRVLGGLDTTDVAAIVGKKPGAVRVLQHRALKRLASELVKEGRRPVTR